MPFFDMPLEQLQQFKPAINEPNDFDSFWETTLSEAREKASDPVYERADFGLRVFETWDVTFSGFDGQPVRGWFIMPAVREEPLPCVVEYIGYGGGRTLPVRWLMWPSAGYATLVMDTRGQGSSWGGGDTPDPGLGVNPAHPGFMTQGILDPHTYYYRRVFTDAVRALETARAHPSVDANRVYVTGRSQGGGISIAVGGLVPDVPAILPSVPYLCNFQQAMGLASDGPYLELANYLAVHRDKINTVYRTLSYFDGMSFAARYAGRALYSVALMDTVCPPSTVYAAYNHSPAEKEIAVYPYNNHEGGEEVHKVRQIEYLHGLDHPQK